MEFNRRLRDRMSVILFLLGNIATVALSGLNCTTGLHLDCNNNFEDTMYCHFDAQNCSEYKLSIQSNEGYGRVNCTVEQCARRCCCSVGLYLVHGETHTARVQKGDQSLGCKNIDVSFTGRPNKPTIIQVDESNGNFIVIWRSNVQRKSTKDSLWAEVTYHKKGDTNKTLVLVKPYEVNGQNTFEISGKDLEPITTYVVRVRSKSNISDLYSDSSEEYEFTTHITMQTAADTTAISRNILLWALIIFLSIFAAILSGAIYFCYVKFKAKLWDSVSDTQNPKVLLMHSSEQEMLKPKPPIISSICVEPFIPVDSKPWSKGSLTDICSNSLHQSSGISTGSSALSYAHTEPADIIACVQDALGKAFPNISPISPVTSNLLTESTKGSGSFSTPYNNCSVKAYDSSSGSSGFDNKTYSILIPACQTVTDSSENQTQAEMLCDSAYHPSEGDMMTCLDKQAPACLVPVQDIIFPPVASSLIQTDMSYQGNADSGRFSYAEDSSLSSISSSTNTTASCDLLSRVENFDECVVATKPDGQSEEVTVCDENPCYNCVPPNSCNFLPVDDNYQAFQSLVKPPDVLISEQRSGEEEEDFDRYPEKASTNILQSFLSPVFPDFTNGVQGGRCFSELQNPFLTVISAGQSLPIITDSGYQSV
ncbi:uncharacterized protein LOC128358907 [Scomber scombrus]|uniref:Uncharacterized protein LOC128358907 n=1 Tax=Scomber scombrus TaxID=13677 RepID=A0AAV1P6I7_SCOSC